MRTRWAGCGGTAGNGTEATTTPPAARWICPKPCIETRSTSTPPRAHAAAQADIDFANEAIGKTERDKAKAAEANAKAYFKHASSSRNASRINGFIALSIPSFLIKADRLDANPFDLNTPAGIVDLRSGGVRPHDPEAYCTQITACPPGTAGAGMWSQFLDWVTGGDPDLCAYLQMVAGMAAVGEVFQEGIVMAYGPGGNGKSTLVNSIGNVLGEYTGSIAIKILTTERQNSGPALATLRGKRLVVAGELEENQRLSVSTLKAACEHGQAGDRRKIPFSRRSEANPTR